MNCAVCISSELRNIKYSFPTIKQLCSKIFNNCKIDYFIYCPNHITRNYSIVNNIFNKSDIEYITDDLIKYVNDTLNPKLFEIEYNYENFNQSINEIKSNYVDLSNIDIYSDQFGGINGKWFNQYYFAQKVIELKQKYENQNNFKYDIAFRIRPDLYFTNLDSLHLELLNDPRFILKKDDSHNRNVWGNSIFVLYSDIRKGNLHIADQIFLGSSESMDVFHKDMLINMIKFHNDVYSNKFNNTIYEYLKSQLYPPEQKWALLGMINKISFIPSLHIQSSIVRDYIDINSWNCSVQEKIRRHERFIEDINYIFGDLARNHKYDILKIISYFKNNTIFEFSDASQLKNWMIENKNKFI